MNFFRKFFKRKYEAGETAPKRFKFPNVLESPRNQSLSRERLRERARHIVRNNPYGSAWVKALVSYGVGKGIYPHSKDPRVEDLLKHWSDSTECDFFGEQNLYGLQSLILKSLAVDGEVFIQKIFSFSSKIPLKLKIIPAHMLDTSQCGHNVIDGIEYDELGRKTGFYFKSHGMNESVRVDEKDLFHLFRKDEPEQTRGVSWLSPVLLRMKDLDEFEDAEIVRQKTAACFVGFYRDIEAQGEDLFSSKDSKDGELSPGSILTCPSGQTLEFSNPPQPLSYGAFVEHSKHTLASGLGIPYMLLSGDYSRCNYSSSRMSMMNFYRYLNNIQETLLTPLFGTIECWFFESLNFKTLSVETDSKWIWTFPPKDLVDPLKDMKAYEKAVERGFRSHQDVIRELGQDPLDVYAEIKESKRKEFFGEAV